MRIACYRVGTLLSHESAGLSEAERLTIESHRESCERCRRDVGFDEALARLAAAAPPRQDAARVGRAIARALAATPERAERPRRWRGWQLGIAGAAVAGAAVVAALWPGDEAPLAIGVDVPAAAPAPAPAPAPEPAEGELAVAASQTFAHAEVTAAAASRFRWDAGARRLSLDSGALRVQVTPNTGKSFTVSTPEFDVRVIGTDFDVDLEGVVVRHGAVRVTSRAGEVLAESLGPGDSWHLEPASELELDEDLTEVVPASEWLLRASAQMRAQSFDRARASIRRALRSGPSRRQRAEAETLRAEIALAHGELGVAVKRYRSIAARFRRYPQGESALFAAARLEAKRGRAAAARSLLERYRQRYPRGRFSREVIRKLRAVEGR